MDTYGWDVVCACSGAKLNKILADQFKKTPASLSYSDGGGSKIKAKFKPWRIVEGGSNKKLHMELPIQKGSLDMPLASVKLDDVVIVVEIELAFVKDANSSTNNLQFNFKATAKKSGSKKDGGVFVVTADKDGILDARDSTGAAKTELHDIVPKCLIANLSKLKYIFTTLNLSPAGDASWLAPHNANYVYVQGGKGQIGYLAIFSMLKNTDTSGFKLKIDPKLVDGKSDVCIAFAPHVFLEHVILPKLPESFPKSSKSDFVMSGNSIELAKHDLGILKVGMLQCKPVKWGLTHYYPVLNDFSIHVSSSKLTTHASGEFDITGLTKSWVSFTESQSMSCDYNSSTGKLEIEADGEPTTDYDKHIPWYIYAAAAPAIAVLGPIIGGVIVAVVDSVVAAVSEAVANSVSKGSSNLALGDWSSVAIEWPGSNKWIVKDAGLSDAFYMRCALK